MFFFVEQIFGENDDYTLGIHIAKQISWKNSCTICYIFKIHFDLVLNKSLNGSGTITLFRHY